MIEINLLPDIKLQYIKTHRSKRLVMATSLAVSVTMIGLTVLLGWHVYVNQIAHTKALQKDIDNTISEINSIDNLDTILTVNQQLLVLPDLHQAKPKVSRLHDLLVKIVPPDIKLNSLSFGFDEEMYEMKFDGTATNIKKVNEFADILKYAQYSVDSEFEKRLIFTNVEFDFRIAEMEGTGFSAVASFDVELFNSQYRQVTFSVPEMISTQSSIRTEEMSLFDAPTEEAQ